MNTIEKINCGDVEEVNRRLKSTHACGLRFPVWFRENELLLSNDYPWRYDMPNFNLINVDLSKKKFLFIEIANSLGIRSHYDLLCAMHSIVTKFPNIVLDINDPNYHLSWLCDCIKHDELKIMASLRVNGHTISRIDIDSDEQKKADFIATTAKPSNTDHIIDLLKQEKKIILTDSLFSSSSRNEPLIKIINETEASDNLYVCTSEPECAMELVKKLGFNK